MVKENKNFEYLKTAILSEEEFHKRIKLEEKKGLLNALFVVHGYIEAILVDLFNYSGNNKPGKVSEETQKNIERIGFLNFASLHLLMGNINQGIFAELKELNAGRNNLAHGIRDIDFNSKRTTKGLQNYLNKGIKLYSKLFKIYQEILDRQSEKI